MPRFYFNDFDGQSTKPDVEGMELPDLTAALAEAVAAVRQLIAEELKFGRSLGVRCIEIADAAGQVLATVPFKDVDSTDVG
jgi:hypothetical protein